MPTHTDSQSLPALIHGGWTRHREDAEQLARELEAANVDHVDPGELAPLIHLVAHMIGEHLGDWPRALALGKRILDQRTPTPQTARAWGRLSVAATVAGALGDATELELRCLYASPGDVAATLLDLRFMLADALIGSERTVDGARVYRRALDLAERVEESPALNRMIAVASNNISWELYERSTRSPEDDALMQLSAETSHTRWLRCGDWINEERALYLKAVVANATSDPIAGLKNADAALAIIAANGERPLDVARLHLARAVSFAAMGNRDAATRALSDADAIASTLTSDDLLAQFATQRASSPALGS